MKVCTVQTLVALGCLDAGHGRCFAEAGDHGSETLLLLAKSRQLQVLGLTVRAQVVTVVRRLSQDHDLGGAVLVRHTRHQRLELLETVPQVYPPHPLHVVVLVALLLRVLLLAEPRRFLPPARRRRTATVLLPLHLPLVLAVRDLIVHQIVVVLVVLLILLLAALRLVLLPLLGGDGLLELAADRLARRQQGRGDLLEMLLVARCRPRGQTSAARGRPARRRPLTQRHHVYLLLCEQNTSLVSGQILHTSAQLSPTTRLK